jgi:primary-amine oxidase
MHPFDPLNPDEITRAAGIVRPHFGSQEPNFRVITLQEPPKKEMILFLEGEHGGGSIDYTPTRCARVEVVIKLPDEDNALFELLVDLDHDKVIGKQHQRGKHSHADTTFMHQVEAACLADKKVQEQIRVLDLPEGSSVVVEPWTYATDGENDMGRRLSMVVALGRGIYRTLMLTIYSAGSISVWRNIMTSTTTRIPSIFVLKCLKICKSPRFIAYP